VSDEGRCPAGGECQAGIGGGENRSATQILAKPIVMGPEIRAAQDYAAATSGKPTFFHKKRSHCRGIERGMVKNSLETVSMGPAGSAFQMKTYLLTCVCAAEVPVGAAQAGGRTSCPACGHHLEVPKLRDLGKLAFREQASVPLRAGWNPRHLLILLGSLMALGCGLLLVVVPAPAPRPDDSSMIKRAVFSTEIHDVYDRWKKSISLSSVGRSLTQKEQRAERMERFQNAVRFGLKSATVLAAAAALGSGLTLLLGRKNAAKGAHLESASGHPR